MHVNAVSSVNAPAVMRSASPRSPATAFVQSLGFSASWKPVSGAILAALSKPDLARAFTQAQAMESAGQSGQGMTAGNARHIALFDVIIAHRDRFPPEDFVIQTEFEGGRISTRIPA